MNIQNKNVNVTISNVIKWFQESEECILHNHAQRIPLTGSVNTQLVQDIIDTEFKG